MAVSVGRSLSEWAKWRDPETYAQIQANYIWMTTVGVNDAEESRKSEKCSEAVARMQERINKDLKEGKIVLELPSASAVDLPEEIPADNNRAVVQKMRFYGLVYDEVYFRDACVEVRVYLASRFVRVDTVTPMPVSPDGAEKDQHSAERRGRKPKYDWDGFWIEICRLCREGKLPAIQADLEKAMLVWFSETRDQYPGNSTVRAKVSRFWTKLRLDD